MTLEERTKFFDRNGKKLRVKDEYRQNVHFHFHNLAGDPIPSASHNIFGLDLIFLRNVLIYFDTKALRDFLGRIHEALVPGGYLAVAPAEVGPDFEHWFTTVPFDGCLLYRRSPGGATVAVPDKTPMPPTGPHAPVTAPKPVVDLDPLDTAEVTLEAAMSGANQGKLSQARTVLENLVKKDSLNFEAHYYLGLVNHNLGETKEAKENLRRVLYLRRDFLLASFHLGLIHREEGDGDEAARIWEHAEEILTRRDPSEMIYSREQLSAGDLLEMVRVALGRNKK